MFPFLFSVLSKQCRMWNTPFLSGIFWPLLCVCFVQSTRPNPNDDGYVKKRFLRQGWLGPTLDGADDQWRELRESLPLIFAAVVGHGLLSLLVRKTNPSPHRSAVQVKTSRRGIKSFRYPSTHYYLVYGSNIFVLSFLCWHFGIECTCESLVLRRWCRAPVVVEFGI